MIKIIGAGRHGLYLGYLLLKNNCDVEIFEKEKEVGFIKGTDIVSINLRNFVKIRGKIVQNKIYGSIFKYKDKEILIRRNFPVAFVLKRPEFELYLRDLFDEAGGKINYNCKFISGTFKKVKIKEGSKIKDIRFNILIGADGVNSQVAKNYKFYRRQEVIFGYEWLVEGNFNEKYVVVNFNIPKYFSWIVPENDSIARIGFITDNPKLYLKKFKKQIEQNYKLIFFYGRQIPIFNSRIRWQKRNIYLLGDSGAMVKATTGGGTIPGFIGANLLSKAILEGKHFDIISKSLKFFLLKHLTIRKFILNKTTGSCKMRILSLIKSFLEVFGDMDYGFKLKYT